MIKTTQRGEGLPTRFSGQNAGKVLYNRIMNEMISSVMLRNIDSRIQDVSCIIMSKLRVVSI